MWPSKPSRVEEKEGVPDINIQGTWAQTVTGVLAIMNTFKFLWLWEEGQQLENVFTVTNFLYQSWAVRVFHWYFTPQQRKSVGKATHNNTLNTHYSRRVGTVPVTLNLFVNMNNLFKAIEFLCTTTERRTQKVDFCVDWPGGWLNEGERVVNSALRVGKEREILLSWLSAPSFWDCTGLGLSVPNQI